MLRNLGAAQLAEGRPVVLGARAFDLLATLIEHRDRRVGKSELLDRVWPSLVVEEGNLAVQVSSLRKVLGAQAIATVPGLGYRFAMAVDEDDGTPPARPQALPAAASGVPAAVDVLLGRDADVAQLSRWLATHRLVTVLGAGGIGKTRVAQAVAQASPAAFAQGVWWVDVAALSAPDKVAPAIAGAVHLPPGEDGDLERLARWLGPRDTLLVLDNCEHLVEEVARVVRAVLAGGAGVRVLTTSQHALRLDGEHLYRLDPLAVPPAGTAPAAARGFAALQLLEHRARATDPRWVLGDAALPQAIELCHRLGGVALAIEMAGARLPLLGMDTLLQRLGDRLGLLRAASRAAPSRQRTLQATLDWSHALLDAAERAVLRRLAVFAGSFRLDAALQVAAFAGLDTDSVLDALAGLVDKSMVGVEQFDPPRYRLADSTRLYARGQLRAAGEVDIALQRHGQALAGVADEAEARSQEPAADWLARYRLDYDDLADAFDAACRRADARVAAATMLALRALDEVRGTQSSSTPRVEAAHALLPQADPASRAVLCYVIASCAWTSVRQASRLETARTGVELLRGMDKVDHLHSALGMFGMEAARRGIFDEAAQALAEARRLETPAWPARKRAMRALQEGYVAGLAGHAPAYRERVQEARALFGPAGSPALAAHALDLLGDATLMAGDTGAAIALGRAAVDELERLDSPAYLAAALVGLLGRLALAGDLAGARATAARVLPLLEQSRSVYRLLSPLALLLALEGRHAGAAVLLGHAEAWNTNHERQRTWNERRMEHEAAALVEAALGSAEHRRLQAEGMRIGADGAAALVRQWLAGAP